jgi:hypothetical protein
MYYCSDRLGVRGTFYLVKKRLLSLMCKRFKKEIMAIFQRSASLGDSCDTSRDSGRVGNFREKQFFNMEIELQDSSR